MNSLSHADREFVYRSGDRWSYIGSLLQHFLCGTNDLFQVASMEQGGSSGSSNNEKLDFFKNQVCI